MEIKGRQVIIPIEDMFNDLEFWYPYYRIQEAGGRVTVVGSGRKQTFQGKSGTEKTVDADAGDVDPLQYDGMIVPGGYAPDLMRRYPEMVGLVRNLHQAKKVVAAICHAGWLLISADILRGKTATSFFAIKDDMINAGVNWVDQDVVVDGNLVTSRTPDDLPVFMRTVIKELQT